MAPSTLCSPARLTWLCLCWPIARANCLSIVLGRRDVPWQRRRRLLGSAVCLTLALTELVCVILLCHRRLGKSLNLRTACYQLHWAIHPYVDTIFLSLSFLFSPSLGLTCFHWSALPPCTVCIWHCLNWRHSSVHLPFFACALAASSASSCTRQWTTTATATDTANCIHQDEVDTHTHSFLEKDWRTSRIRIRISNSRCISKKGK